MAIQNFNGQLNANEIFSSIFNMIISQQVFANNIGNHFSSLIDSARVDGGLYGDTKLYYATDALKTKPWLGDAEASNLLALARPEAPACQKITIDQFRICETTTDNYLTKRAWADEGSFAQFMSVTLGWLSETKKIYETTLYNATFGTCESTAKKGIVSITVPQGANEALVVGQGIADLVTDMSDISRDYNEYGYLRSYNPSEVKFVSNAKFINKFTKLDLPAVFHKDGLIDRLTANVLPARYFGHRIFADNISDYSAETPTTGKPIASATGAYTPGTNNANGTLRSLIETDVTVSGTVYHLFPADELPAGTTVGTGKQILPGEFYIESDDIVCKAFVGNPMPIMSAFQVQETFHNNRSLTDNHYLIFGINTLENLYNLPLITVEVD